MNSWKHRMKGKGWSRRGMKKKGRSVLARPVNALRVFSLTVSASSFKRILNKTHCLESSLLKRSFWYHRGTDGAIIAQKLVRFNRAKLNARLRKTLQIICFSRLLIQRIMHLANSINIYNLLFHIFYIIKIHYFITMRLRFVICIINIVNRYCSSFVYLPLCPEKLWNL